MDMETLLSFNWSIFLPEFLILGIATLLALFDLFLPEKVRRVHLGWLAALGTVLAIIVLCFQFTIPATSILNDTIYVDSFSRAFKLLILVGGLFILILATASEHQDGMERHVGEYYYLLLSALLGGMIVASSGDLITLFIGLELMSISSYVLVGLKKYNVSSTEAAMKYLINGSIATAIYLFGFSYLYGLSGTTNLKEMGTILFNYTTEGDLYFLIFTLGFIVVGLSFKMATVPFHLWVPDVYEGAPTIVTGFLSVISKTVGFVFFIRLMYGIFSRIPTEGNENLLIYAQVFLLGLAIFTMLFGNLMALRQRNIKRMFAYSSIAHAGYLLAGFATYSQLSLDTVWFYLLTYLFMNIGAFAIIYWLTEKEQSADIKHFAGLYRRAPFLAISMSIFLLGLAGIPFTSGFIAKLKVIMSALMVSEAQVLLVVMVIVASVISYVYYFGVMIQLYFRPEASPEKVKVSFPFLTVIAICVVATIWFGIMPNSASDLIYHTFNGFHDFLK